MKILLVLALATMLTACGAPGLVPAAPTGTVSGTVLISPCRPVERQGDPPCPPRPGITVHFESSSSPATAVTDATGTYSARLAAGSYQVWAEGGIGRGRTVPLTVVAGQAATLNLTVDSGIR